MSPDPVIYQLPPGILHHGLPDVKDVKPATTKEEEDKKRKEEERKKKVGKTNPYSVLRIHDILVWIHASD
jgi:hypothetical protein